MKSEQHWKNKFYPRELKKLPPRIQRDFQLIGFPEDLPEEITSTFVQGEIGSGKTLYAVALMLEKRKQMYLRGETGECVFISTVDLFNELRSCFETPEKSEYEILQYFYGVDLLVLDDFGTVKPTDWVMQTLYGIVNYRYEYLLPTIYTSNKSLDEIAEFFNDNRITSRIEREAKIIEKTHWNNGKET